MLCVCVNFIHKWSQFKVDSKRQIFWETFHGSFNHPQSFCQKSAQRKLPKEYLPVRIIDIVSHITYVGCVNFIHNGGAYSLKSTPNDTFFLMAHLITLRVFASNLLRVNCRRKMFFVFYFDVWPGARTVALRLISQHTTN